MARKINAAGLELVKSFEGLRLKAYRDAVGVMTIGWGSTGPHVKDGMEITLQEAEALLRSDLARFERGVEKAVGDAPTSSNEFSAFVSLAYNIGLGAFTGSTALKRHRHGNKIGAGNAILWFNKAGGKILKGLVRRREAERALYLMPDILGTPKLDKVKKAQETPAEPPVAPKPVPEVSAPPEPPLGCLAAIMGLFR